MLLRTSPAIRNAPARVVSNSAKFWSPQLVKQSRQMSTQEVMGQMYRKPLLVSSLLDHATKVYGATEIVSRTIEDPSKLHRYCFTDLETRSKQLANVLKDRCIGQGDRVGTLAWNGYRHLELYYAVSGSGAILHTINPRMHSEQLAYVINHAQDKLIFVDLTFVPLLEAIRDSINGLQAIVVMTDRANMPQDSPLELLCYEDLVTAANTAYVWPSLPEEMASSMCYTSGTTGNPKGVLYSHRSTVLHSWSLCSANSFALAADEVCLPIVPMFHVNAWGIPYGAAMSGCKLVFPGGALDGPRLYQLLEDEKVTMSAGVPTVCQSLLDHLETPDEEPESKPEQVSAPRRQLSTLQRLVIGGAACPSSLLWSFENNFSVRVQHAWGMTELSPTGCVNDQPKLSRNQHIDTVVDDAAQDSRGTADEKALKLKQGRVVFGVEMKCVDDNGRECQRDGQSAGVLWCRGHWVTNGYYGLDKQVVDAEGWFDTGDIATITADGYVEIVDRAKDLIKSGGEWISSAAIENAALLHPAVIQAAAIAVPDNKWGERPVLCVVLKNDAEQISNDGPSWVSWVHQEEDSIKNLLARSLPKWAIPDRVFQRKDSLPIGPTGKVLKTVLLDEYQLWEERQH